MKRRIFSVSNKSKIKCNLDFRPNSWHLRSAFNRYRFPVCAVNFYGHVCYIHLSYDLGIVPVCMIWNQFKFTKPMLDVIPKILITEFDQDFTNPYSWCIRSVRSSRVYFVGFVFDYVDYNYVDLDYGITPVCTI